MKIQPSITYPQTLRNVTHIGFQVGMIVLTLFLILYYNFAYYLYVPLTGVWLDYVDLPRNLYPSKMRVKRPKKEQDSHEATNARTNCTAIA